MGNKKNPGAVCWTAGADCSGRDSKSASAHFHRPMMKSKTTKGNAAPQKQQFVKQAILLKQERAAKKDIK